MKQNPLSEYIVLDRTVQEALENNRPLVALESCLLTHGLPYPSNINLLMDMYGILSDQGAIPALILIDQGKIRVGVQESEISSILDRSSAKKVASHEIGLAIASQGLASTTVSSTIRVASLIGIEVFATGGIGGVHRNFCDSFDVSRDIGELAESETLTVCAGAKSILDISKTLEALESSGVAILGFKTNKFPGFYTPETLHKLAFQASSAKEAANTYRLHKRIGKGSLLLANPIPIEDALDATHLESLIDQALREAKNQSISGKNVTPFLLEWIKTKSHGLSVKANESLIRNNTLLAAQVARELVNF